MVEEGLARPSEFGVDVLSQLHEDLRRVLKLGPA
jgi:hypothetical protein